MVVEIMSVHISDMSFADSLSLDIIVVDLDCPLSSDLNVHVCNKNPV